MSGDELNKSSTSWETMTPSEENVREDIFIENLITSHKVVSFSKSFCPYCKTVEKIFAGLNEVIYVVQLDLLENGLGSLVQERLYERTGQKTVPNVFIHGKPIGGCSDIEQALTDGTLFDILRSNFQNYSYDLIVIGGGSGGLAAAKEAAKLGKRVAVCDYVKPSPRGTSWGLGGTCVNVGCIPKKLMHQAALCREFVKDAESFGWAIPESGITHNWKKLVKAVNDHVKSLNWQCKVTLREKGISYLNAMASFISPHELKLWHSAEGETTVTAQNIIIAVGGRPHYPEIEGALKYCITSDDLFTLDHPPGKTLLVGASYIALECAGFLAGLNFDCTVMVRSILLRGFDREMAEKVGENMKEVGINFVYGCVPTKISLKQKGVPPTLFVEGVFDDGTSFGDTFNTVILATGRTPCTEALKLEEIGVEVRDMNKKIIVDDEDRTSIKTIFAIGDVADGRPELTPVAIQTGRLLARRLYGRSKVLMDYNCVPTTIFTPSEYGCIGLSEEKAKLMYQMEPEVFHNNFLPLEKAVTPNPRNGFAKLICVPGVDGEMKVVGLHVIGPNAGEIVQGFTLAIKMGVTKKQFDELIGIHPTCAEIFTNMFVTKSSGVDINKTSC